MKYPTWKEFESKYPEYQEDAFEALARMLFRIRFGLSDSLPYFKNHAGNETETIVDDGIVTGFQAKYFDNEINAQKIEHSIKTARANNPTQKKMIVYTNLEFGNPQKGEKKTEKQKHIEKVANDCGIELEWMYGNNILDAVLKNELAYNVFFNTKSHLQHLPEDLCDFNDSQLSYIQGDICVADRKYRFDRSISITQLGDYIAKKSNVMIAGESGCGKSAILKEYYNRHKDNGDYVFCIINATQLNTIEINTIFHYNHAYVFSEFCTYYAEVKHKIFVLDSVEQMLDLDNRRVALMLFDKLKKEDWTIVVTCKSNSQADVLELFREDFQIEFQLVEVCALADYEFEDFVKTTNVQVPLDEKLKQQIRIPFYLARYCEVGGTERSIISFRDRIWKQKVRRATSIGREIEYCLFEIVRRRLSTGSYLVPVDGLDSQCIDWLKMADVIGERGHYGIFIKHDIYVDWALDYMLIANLRDNQTIKSTLHEKPSISYVNAFRRWLTEQVKTDNAVMDTILTVMFDGSIDDRWINTILEVIGSSDDYADIFVSNYNSQLCVDDYYWFDKFANIVCVSCNALIQYIPYRNGIRIPITNAIGSGWEAAIVFIEKEKGSYYIDNLPIVYNVLNGYYGKRKKNDKIAGYAGSLALRLFDLAAAQEDVDGMYLWQVNMEDWAALVCKYSTYICDELNGVLKKVVDNNWTEHNSPYNELVEYLITPPSTFVDIQVYLACRLTLLPVMKLFWLEKSDKDCNYSAVGTGRYFGINDYCGGGRGYFPPSPYQTPVFGMLNTENMTSIEDRATLDFAIDFINDCVACFNKKGHGLQALEKVTVTFEDGSVHDVWCSSMLWNIYRGTSGITVPHLLESIHMAIEKFLLDMLEDNLKNKNTEKVRSLLWHILRNSSSASMYAIVASVVIAHYTDFFDLFLFLIQDIKFLQLDLHRQIDEHQATSFSYIYNMHRDYATERKKSAEMEHRKLHLESVLTNLQITYENSSKEESAERLKKLYACVDKLEADYKSLPQKVLSDEPYIMGRIDVRKWKKNPVKLSNGEDAISYEPVFNEELIRKRDESERASHNMLLGLNVTVWADKMLKGQVDGAQIYEFHDKPDEILRIISETEDALKDEGNRCGISMGKEFVPYIGSAALLIYYKKRLTKEQAKFCSQKVIDALCAPDFLLSSIMSGLDTILRAIPVLVDAYPESSDLMADIMLLYAKRREETSNYRLCDKIRQMILSCKMWECQESFMKMVVDRFREGLQLNREEEISLEDAVTMLSLLTEQPKDRRLANICVKKLTKHWDMNERNGIHDYNKGYDCIFLASYLMSSPDDEIPGLASIFGDCMARKQNCESLLSLMLIECVCDVKYDKFWKVWYALFPSLVKSAILLDHAARMDYMLCPSFLRESSNDWFRFEAKDVAFFKRLSDNVGPDDEVLFCALRVFNTIGSNYQISALPIIYKQTRKPISRWSNLKKQIVGELNLFIDRLYDKNRSEIIVDGELLDQYCKVLEFAKDNNSETAARILKTL